MADTTVITKLDNGNVLVEATGETYTRNPDVSLAKKSDKVLVLSKSGSIVDTFKVDDVLKVVRVDTTEVPISDADTLFNELSNFFFFKSGSGGNVSANLKHLGNFDDYDDLVAQHPTSIIGTLAYAENSQGIKWLTNLLGGNYFPKGDYLWNGVFWDSGTEEISQQFAKLPDNDVVFKSESDLPAPIGGEIFPLDKVNYKLGTSLLILTKPLNLSNISNISSWIMGNNRILYTGTGAMFRGTFTGAFLIQDGLFTGNGTNSMYDIKGAGNPSSSILVINRSTLTDFAGIGKIEFFGAVNYNSILHSDCGTGLVLKDNIIFHSNNDPFTNTVSSNSPRIVLTGTIVNHTFSGHPLTMQSGESFIQISKNLNIIGNVFINGNQYSKDLGAEFYASAKTGANTSYTNNGSGGTTVTSAGHGLTIEHVAEVIGTVNYDGDHEIFNITTNTFDIPVAFVIDEGAVGSFDTGDSSVFRDNVKVDSKPNGDDIDSNEVSKYKSVNTITITPIVIGIPVNVTGVLADWQGIIDRRFVTNFPGDPVGTSRYIGTKPLLMRLSQRVTVDVQGGAAKDVSACITINGAFQIDSRFIVNSGRSVTLNPEDVIELQPNDVVGTSVSNETDFTLIDVTLVNNNTIKA